MTDFTKQLKIIMLKNALKYNDPKVFLTAGFPGAVE